MANNFKNINYGRQLYESLRSYFSVNAAGALSQLFLFCSALIQPLQDPFNSFATSRNQIALVAQCKWQIGQLTNLLNYLYDPVSKRITITQSVISILSDPTFAYAATNFDKTFADATEQFERCFGDPASESEVTFNVPTAVMSASGSLITATVAQVAITGISYQFQTF